MAKVDLPRGRDMPAVTTTTDVGVKGFAGMFEV
jgi:hypothetical protein